MDGKCSGLDGKNGERAKNSHLHNYRSYYNPWNYWFIPNTCFGESYRRYAKNKSVL